MTGELKGTMISRIWHGWTTPDNADKYEALLKEEIFIGILNRDNPGFKSIQMLRREIEDEVEFVTIMEFDSLDAVRDFAGQDYEVAVVPAVDRLRNRPRMAASGRAHEISNITPYWKFASPIRTVDAGVVGSKPESLTIKTPLFLRSNNTKKIIDAIINEG